MVYVAGPILAEILLKNGFKEIAQKLGKRRFIKNGLIVIFDYENIQIIERAASFDCDYAITEEQLQTIIYLSASYSRRSRYSDIEQALRSTVFSLSDIN